MILQHNQKVRLFIQPKDAAGHPVDPATIQSLRFESDYPPVVEIPVNLEPDGVSAWAFARLAGEAVVRVRGGNIPDETLSITVVGPVASFNLQADAPVSQ